MTAPTVTVREVEAVVDTVLDQFREEFPPAAVAISARPSWDGPETLSIGGVEFAVVPCQSVLAVRSALVEATGPLIILTERDRRELGVDVCARLADGRPRTSDRREAVKRIFGALRLDPRLAKERWLTDELLAAAPPTGYAKVTSGVLTVEHAMGALADTYLGLSELAPPPDAFLAWANEPESRARVLKAPEAFVAKLFEEVLPGAVPFAPHIAAAFRAETPTDLVVLGIAAGVVSGGGASNQAAAAEALFRSRIGGERLAPAVGRAWGEAATRIVEQRLAAEDDVEPLLADAEQLLKDLDATELALGSDLLRSSFDARLRAHAHALLVDLADDAGAAPSSLESLESIRAHRFAKARLRQLARAEMAVRLVQWLKCDRIEADALSTAGRDYRNEGSWADYARRVLGEAESDPSLAEAYKSVLAQADARRTSDNRLFAQHLSAWDQSDSPSLLPIEDVLDDVVAPLAELQPVLLLVMDGMGWDVWHELTTDVVRRSWTRVIDVEGSVDRPCVATFPTVTSHSRTSLLTGRLHADGDQSDEKREFPSHPALAKASAAGKPPAIFHKGELSRSDGGGLADGLADLIADPNQRVVACVVNAIDDHLLRGDQVRPDWTIDVISPLDLLLDRAQYAQRAIVVTSDHGHVLDVDSEARVIAGAKERWRPDDGTLADDEVRVTGPRTLDGGGTVVMPFIEQLRYSSGRRNGYHGGATPQEVLIPVDVMVTGGAPAGWEAAPHRKPAWWTLGVTRAEHVQAAPPPAPRETDEAETKEGQQPLFPTGAAREHATWIDALLASSVMDSQRERAGARAPSDERVRLVLAALSGNDDRLTHAELADATGVAFGRVRGLVASIVRLLNVDSYPVLEDDGEIVVLDQQLARTQFGLDS